MPDCQCGPIDRQAIQPYAGRGINRVTQCRRPGGGASLTDTARLLPAFDNVHLDWRHLIDPQHAVIVEIRLTHAAFVDGDLAEQRRGQTKDQPALELGDDNVGIDRNASVNNRGYFAQSRPRRDRPLAPRPRWQ